MMKVEMQGVAAVRTGRNENNSKAMKQTGACLTLLSTRHLNIAVLVSNLDKARQESNGILLPAQSSTSPQANQGSYPHKSAACPITGSLPQKSVHVRSSE